MMKFCMLSLNPFYSEFFILSYVFIEDIYKFYICFHISRIKTKDEDSRKILCNIFALKKVCNEKQF